MLANSIAEISLSAVLLLFAGLAVYAFSYIKRIKNEYSDDLTEKAFHLDEKTKKIYSLEAANEILERNLSDKNLDFEKRVGEIKELYESRLLSQKDDYELRLENQKKELLDLEKRLKEIVENISGRMLDENGRKFTDLNRENMEGILKPLNDKLKEFKEKVEETYMNETRERFSLKQEITRLIETESTMKNVTENLTKALKGDSKVQGGWGEVILATILENSGLLEGENFDLQKTMKSEDEDGKTKNLRPDAVLHLPENRDIVIDSKVSLTDYEKYINSSGNEAERNISLEAHINSLKRHISSLSGKNYHDLAGVKSLDFVIMFVPIDYALSVAVGKNPGIIEEGYKNNVIIATPSVLLIIIKIISNLWYRSNLNKNSEKIAVEAKNLYDKFVNFIQNMTKIDKNIGEAKKAYDDAYKQLSSGKGNIIKRLEDIKNLGINVTKSLPENIDYEE